MITKGSVIQHVEFGDEVIYLGQRYTFVDVVFIRYDSKRELNRLVLKGINGLIIVDTCDVTVPLETAFEAFDGEVEIRAYFPAYSRDPEQTTTKKVK